MPKNKKILYGIFVGSFLALALIALVVFSKAPPQAPQPPEKIPEEESQVEKSLIKEAQTDLAARLGVSEDKIKFFSAERVDWSDGCLGISRPDVACIQVITPGFKILLQLNSQTYEYHTSLSHVVYAGRRQ